MRRFTMLTICLIAVAAFMATAAQAQSPHFISASDAIVTSGTDAGDVLVSFKEAGLGQNVTINYTASGNGTATYACINKGGNHPSASNKVTNAGPVIGSGSFSSGKSGNITATLEVEEVGAGSFSCPGGQSLVLGSVSFTGLSINDTLNGLSEPVADQSVTFCDIDNLTKATLKNCVTPD
jgi:hypothetical protein